VDPVGPPHAQQADDAPTPDVDDVLGQEVPAYVAADAALAAEQRDVRRLAAIGGEVAEEAHDVVVGVAARGGQEAHARPLPLDEPQAIADALDANPREAERKQTAQLLGLWDTALLTALGGGGFRRFSALPRERREEVLRSWCDSRLGQRRAAFAALRKAALLF